MCHGFPHCQDYGCPEHVCCDVCGRLSAPERSSWAATLASHEGEPLAGARLHPRGGVWCGVEGSYGEFESVSVKEMAKVEEPFELRHGVLLGLQGALLVVVAGLRWTNNASSAPLIGILVECVVVLLVYSYYWAYKTVHHVYKMTLVTSVLLALVILTLTLDAKSWSHHWAFNATGLLVGVGALFYVARWAVRLQQKPSE